MSPGLIQACNTTSLSQCNITPQTTYHTPFYFSAIIPVQPHYPEIDGDAVMMCGTKAGQIDEQSLHTVEDNKFHDKENDEQYVVWKRFGFTLIGRVGQDSLSPILRYPASTPRTHTNRLVSPTRRSQPAFPQAYTSHGTSRFPLELVSTRLLPMVSMRIGGPLDPRDQSDNKHPVESIAKHSSASTISLEISPQSLTSQTFRHYKSCPGYEEGESSRSPGSRRPSRKE